MTLTAPRNLNNPGAFALEGEDGPPATGRSASRYALGTNSEGRPVANQAEAVVHAYRELTEERIRQAPQLVLDAKTIHLFAVIPPDPDDPEAGYRIVSRGEISRPPERVSVYSGRFSKPAAEGGGLLDLLYLGDEKTLASVRDEHAWAALKALADDLKPTGQELRLLNDTLCQILALRCGLIVRREELPHFEVAA